ncbi:hypothetical protein [Pseudophaeobacter leonis]|uniref:COG3904 family protein n=1 Tax=Pseudophaeobacter leonis TaxID=1144477 RepID=UPI0009F1D815|nr:hypothetical protein [Pseudophaeobacter leonis]
MTRLLAACALTPVLASVLACALAITPAFAKEPLSDKFEVAGAVLIYDTEKTGDEIRDEDVSQLKRVLSRHRQIRELQLNSSGGSVFAGTEMAGVVLHYALDTHVAGECVSACVDVFLAGNRRRMARGSKIGFHHRSWGPQAVQSYYRDQRKEKDWATPFEFGSWIYGDTQSEIYEHLIYMVSRGVEPGFAVETLQAVASEEWYPSRTQLISAGVLREGRGAE